MKNLVKCLRQRESIIGVQWGQGNPNPRVHRSSGKRGFAEFPTGTVAPRVGISRFHCNEATMKPQNFKESKLPKGHSAMVPYVKKT